MKICNIFEGGSDKVFAVCFEPGDDFEIPFEDSSVPMDELTRNFKLWADVSWLRAFFMRYRADLEERDCDVSVREAIKITIHDARDLYDELLGIAARGDEKELFRLFKPLDNREANVAPYDLQMMKGKRVRSWLRIYALRFKDGFVITGGAIKLTKDMKRPHLKSELYKLKLVKEWIGEDVDDRPIFVYLDITKRYE